MVLQMAFIKKKYVKLMFAPTLSAGGFPGCPIHGQRDDYTISEYSHGHF